MYAASRPKVCFFLLCVGFGARTGQTPIVFSSKIGFCVFSRSDKFAPLCGVCPAHAPDFIPEI
jgi:hypothetical protein